MVFQIRLSSPSCPQQVKNTARLTGAFLLLTAITLLGACTTDNIGNGLRPSTKVGNPATPQPIDTAQTPTNPNALAPIDDPQPDPSASRTANLNPSPGVAFLPVLGPPQSAVSGLSKAVVRSARENAVTIIPNGQPGAKYQVKGYFSALDDGTGTRLVYIWDVLDNSGRNIHRITGEERTSSRSADPWSAINSDVLNAVVDSTMLKFRDWLSTRA